MLAYFFLLFSNDFKKNLYALIAQIITLYILCFKLNTDRIVVVNVYRLLMCSGVFRVTYLCKFWCMIKTTNIRITHKLHYRDFFS